MTARDAIAHSIYLNEIVTVPWDFETFDTLKRIAGFYTLTATGYQFDGGDESARNDWTVIVEKKQ